MKKTSEDLPPFYLFVYLFFCKRVKIIETQTLKSEKIWDGTVLILLVEADRRNIFGVVKMKLWSIFSEAYPCLPVEIPCRRIGLEIQLRGELNVGPRFFYSPE